MLQKEVVVPCAFSRGKLSTRPRPASTLQGQSEEKPRHLYSELGTGLVSFWNMPCALFVYMNRLIM